MEVKEQLKRQPVPSAEQRLAQSSKDASSAPVLQNAEPLTPQENALVAYLTQGVPLMTAGRMSGINSPKQVLRIADKPQVKHAIQYVQHLAMERMVISKELLTSQLYEERAKAATAGEGIAALREIAKLHGLYEAQKIEVTKTEIKSVRQIEAMDDAELGRLVEDADFEDLAPTPLEHDDAD